MSTPNTYAEEFLAIKKRWGDDDSIPGRSIMRLAMELRETRCRSWVVDIQLQALLRRYDNDK